MVRPIDQETTVIEDSLFLEIPREWGTPKHRESPKEALSRQEAEGVGKR